MDILNILLGAVSNGLYSLYPELDIYTELVPEKLPKKCFLIGYAGEPTINKDLGERYLVSGKIDIAYFVPKKSKELNEEFNRVFSTIAFGLQHLSYEEVNVRLFNHKREIVDDVLHDICSFECYIFRIDNTPLINEVSVNEEAIK